MSSEQTPPLETKPKNNGARGVAYEAHAISKHARIHEDRCVFAGGAIPDALLAMASARPVTTEAILASKREHARGVEDALKRGEAPVRTLSEHFGLDGVSVDMKAWKSNCANLSDSLRIIEAKVGVADAHVLGPSIARCFTNLAVYGRDALPPLDLLSPHKPTPAVFRTFAPIPGAFAHERIPEAPSVLEPTDADVADEGIQPFRWQETLARKTVGAWKQHRVCIANVVMGLGKTIAAFVALRRAEKRPLKLFCAHTTVVARQAIDEARKLGIVALDLTHYRTTNEAVAARVGAGTDAGTDVSSDDADDADDAEPDAAECARLVAALADLSRRASVDSPVYAVCCHATLRALAKHEFDYFGCSVALVIDEFHKIKCSKLVFDAVLEPTYNMRSLLMSATPPLVWDVGALGEATAAALAEAPVISRLGLAHGIGLRRLVPTHVEVVVAADADTGELRDSATATLTKKVQATAAWVASNNFATTSVYASRCDEANEFAAALGAALEALGGGRAWCASVHSAKPAKANDDALAHFKADTFSTDGVVHKVVVSVGMLKEGFNMPSLQAVVLLTPPDDAASVLQMAGRAMRASHGKTVARLLAFGEDKAAACVGRMLHVYDREQAAVTVGAVADSYKAQLASTVPGAARASLAAKGAKVVAKTKERLKNIVLAACDNETLRTAQVDAFVAQFDKKPKNDDSKLVFVIDKVKIPIEAYSWWCNVRGADWHKDHGIRSLSVVNKTKLESLVFWTIPDTNRASPQERILDVENFIKKKGVLPSDYATDVHEKSTATWLNGLMTKGKACSAAAVRKSVGDARMDEFMSILNATPNKSRASTLASIEAIARACLERRGQPKPWPVKIKGKRIPEADTLDNMRRGSTGPDNADAARAIFARVLGDSRDSNALKYLEASLSLGLEKHVGFKARTAARTRLRKRKRESEAEAEASR